MKFVEFLSLTPGTGVIFDGKDGVVTKVNDVEKGFVDREIDCMTGEQMTFKALRAVREVEISYIDECTGNIQHLYPVVFIDHPESTHNHYILSRMKLWDPFEPPATPII